MLYYLKDGRWSEPLDEWAILALIEIGTITPETQIRKEGWKSARKAKSVFREAFMNERRIPLAPNNAPHIPNPDVSIQTDIIPPIIEPRVTTPQITDFQSQIPSIVPPTIEIPKTKMKNFFEIRAVVFGTILVITLVVIICASATMSHDAGTMSHDVSRFVIYGNF
jgi:hypothetical protein